MLLNTNPSYGTGFARSKAESAFPEMWDGLVGLWAFYLGPGQPRDWSGKNNHGAFQNMGVTDWAGDRLDFPDVANEYVRIADSASLGVTTKFTVISRIYPDAVDGTRSVFDKLDVERISYAFDVTDGKIQLAGSEDGDVSGFWLWLSTDAVIGTDPSGYHIAAVFDGDNGNVDMYLNGIEVSSGSASSPSLAFAGTADAGIGSAVFTDGNDFDGRIEYVYLYNRMLTSVEMYQHFVNPKGPLVRKQRTTYFVPAAAGISMPLVMAQMDQYNGGIAL